MNLFDATASAIGAAFILMMFLFFFIPGWMMKKSAERFKTTLKELSAEHGGTYFPGTFLKGPKATFKISGREVTAEAIGGLNSDAYYWYFVSFWVRTGHKGKVDGITRIVHAYGDVFDVKGKDERWRGIIDSGLKEKLTGLKAHTNRAWKVLKLEIRPDELLCEYDSDYPDRETALKVIEVLFTIADRMEQVNTPRGN
jgi:hypothetical protein